MCNLFRSLNVIGDIIAYPCDRHSFLIYNDTIILEDAKGSTLDLSRDVVPIYKYFTREIPEMATNLPTTDAEVFEWTPEELFPGRLDNPRVKTWTYFTDLDSLRMQNPGIVVLSIGALPDDLQQYWRELEIIDHRVEGYMT